VKIGDYAQVPYVYSIRRRCLTTCVYRRAARDATRSYVGRRTLLSSDVW